MVFGGVETGAMTNGRAGALRTDPMVYRTDLTAADVVRNLGRPSVGGHTQPVFPA